MNKKRILFVCLGNICRSPAAEAIFISIVEKNGTSDQFLIDSAGTGGYHIGRRADDRMIAHASRRGIEILSRARKFEAADFENFDMIIGMDDDNIANIKSLATSPEHYEKVYRMTSFCSHSDFSYVPDPYYQGDEGFELVLNLLEDACQGLYKKVQ